MVKTEEVSHGGHDMRFSGRGCGCEPCMLRGPFYESVHFSNANKAGQFFEVLAPEPGRKSAALIAVSSDADPAAAFNRLFG